MKKQQLFVLIVVLALTGGAAVALGWLKSHQKLGTPGVRTEPIPGSPRLTVLLPEKVLDYDSKIIEQDPIVTNTLPADTSYGQRYYRASDDFGVQLNVVLMGGDRTSIHKPQFCLVGAGWRIDKTEPTTITIGGPHPYELPVMKLTASKEISAEGRTMTLSRVYVYWFVADHSITEEHWERMWWMAKDLLRTGVLQRWAYVTCTSVCLPGQEGAVFDRIEKFIAAAVPEFQLAEGRAATLTTANTESK